MAHPCPVCGYPELREPPRSGGGSYEICPCCGFQFGVSDDDCHFTYEQWRIKWRKSGMKWTSRSLTRPAKWNPGQQLTQMPTKSRPPGKPVTRDAHTPHQTGIAAPTKRCPPKPAPTNKRTPRKR